jgi:DNA-binding NtrC family response regulator
LGEEVRTGRFRQDLFWRLNVLSIRVPPLRERVADIALLVEHFAAGRPVSAEAMARLTAHPWPGNVRELRNAIERALAMRTSDSIEARDLAELSTETTGGLLAGSIEQQVPLRELERSYILMVLDNVRGNKSRAAEILGLDRKTLYRKLEEFAHDKSAVAGPEDRPEPQ